MRSIIGFGGSMRPGVISTLCGTGEREFCGDDGPAALAQLNERICSTRLNDRIPVLDRENSLVRALSLSCRGPNNGSNAGERISALL
jgi:hypothetical protein